MRRKPGRWIGALLSIILVSNCGINVKAAAVNNTGETEAAAGELTPEQLQYEKELQEVYDKKVETNEIKGWPQGPQIYGEAAIVMDMQTGAVLYGKGLDEEHYPASITKILTALVALENSSMTDKVSFSKESIDCLKREYAHIGMKPGEEITMKDALYAMMLASANEVAYAIAETVGGTYDNFIHMMNEKAKELGCKKTHFINANGMFDEEHYTSARDMALISRAAFQNEDLLEVVQTLQYTIPPTNMQAEQRVFQQKHKMMVKGKFFDERCIGGKTGYTDEASNTLVTVMKQGDRKILAVILKERKDIYPATKEICNYAFENFEEVNIAANEKSKELSNIDTDACVTLPKGADFEDLKWKADGDGNVNYSYKGQFVGTAKAEVKKEVKTEPKTEEKEKKKEKKEKNPIGNIILKVVTGIVIFAAAVVGIMLHVKLAKRRKSRLMKERNRRKMLEKRRRQRRQDNQFD